MGDEEGLRREAVRRRIAGESEAAIAADLGRSRRWVRKWLRRYRTDPRRDRWFQARSRAPERSPHQTPQHICDQVVEARRKLEDDRGRSAARPRWPGSCT